jgi:hypothetical protein
VSGSLCAPFHLRSPCGENPFFSLRLLGSAATEKQAQWCAGGVLGLSGSPYAFVLAFRCKMYLQLLTRARILVLQSTCSSDSLSGSDDSFTQSTRQQQKLAASLTSGRTPSAMHSPLHQADDRAGRLIAELLCTDGTGFERDVSVETSTTSPMEVLAPRLRFAVRAYQPQHFAHK